MNYNRFTIKDFVLDEHFQEWILQPGLETNIFWKGWLEQHPEKAETLKSARNIILELQFKEPTPAAARKEQLWKIITEANAVYDVASKRKTSHPGKASVIKLPLWQEWGRLAAAILLLITVSLGYIIINKIGSKIEQVTDFGQTKTIVLPDNSKVILNANSKITYSKSWDKNETREVWLLGEAFFSVQHTNTNQKFIVHASERVDVEVLGTTFNVLQRPNKTQVVLNSGKIKLNLGQTDKHQQIIMKPGDLVEFKKETTAYIKKQIDPAQFSSWTQNKLTFDGTSLEDIITLLQENYGLQVTISDSVLLQQKLWGSVPSNDVGLLLAAMSDSFNLIIHQTGSQVQISDKKEKEN